MKTEPPETLIRAIRDVLAGRIYLSENLRDRLVSELAPSKKGAQPSSLALSEREQQIFKMIGTGKTSREIAAALRISPKTVEAHREHIKRKLGLANSPQLIRHAVEYVQKITAV
jgi:DNA-binding NarL/FixJ family response regulator